jgi:hypothetical protein
VFIDEEGAGKHITAGAKKVVITAPGKGNIPTYVMGVNAHEMTGDEPIVSNASCTTNGMACFVKVRVTRTLLPGFCRPRVAGHVRSASNLHMRPRDSRRERQQDAPFPSDAWYDEGDGGTDADGGSVSRLSYNRCSRRSSAS